MLVLLYIAAIAAANVVTAIYAPLLLHISGEVIAIPMGTFFIGATFFLRDFVQSRYGLLAAYAAIGAALMVNLLLSVYYADLLAITLASAGAFALSETSDTIIYTAVNGRMAPRIIYSGAVSCPIDSTVFVLFGLSPWTTGIVPWSAVFLTIVAQVVIKFGLQLAVAIPMWQAERRAVAA